MHTAPVTFVFLTALTVWGGTKPLHAQAHDSANIKALRDQKQTFSSTDSVGWHAREGKYYQRNWGIDVVDVRRVASGEMLAFRYIVLDPEKAKTLNDARNTAYLVDERSGTRLKVPQMEKVGSLRTTVSPKVDRMYWMVFANTGGLVHTGSLVDVVIGEIHVNGLTVQSK